MGVLPYPIMENGREKTMEHEMETGSYNFPGRGQQNTSLARKEVEQKLTKN